MKKIWKNIKGSALKSWKYLDGKKMFIGGAIFLFAKGGKALAPNLLEPAQYEFLEYVGEGIAGVGWMHKVAKTNTVNDAIKRAQKVMNSRKAK